MSSKIDCEMAYDNQNAIAEDPPTFEEAMAGIEATDIGGGASKKSFFQRIRIKKFSGKEGNDFIINDAEKQDKKENITKNGEEEGKNPLNCFQKFIRMLKLMSALTTIISDLVLWACGMAILITGYYIWKKKYEIIQLLEFYDKQIRAIGQTFIISGSIYISLVVPFGILGTWLHKRKLLRLHNFWLLVNILAEGIILYMLFRQLYKTKAKDIENDFVTAFTRIYLACDGHEEIGSKTGKCCCTKKIGNDWPCWEYETTEPKGNMSIPKEKQIYYMQCRNNTSLLLKVQKMKKQAFDYLPIFMGIQIFVGLPKASRPVFSDTLNTPLLRHWFRKLPFQPADYWYLYLAIALFFGWLTVRGIPEPLPVDEPDEIIEVKKPYRKKCKLNLFYKVLIFFIFKRIFIILFFMLFSLLVMLFRDYAKNKKVLISGMGEQNLWAVISAIFSFRY